MTSVNPLQVQILATTTRLDDALQLLAKALDGRPEAVDCLLCALSGNRQRGQDVQDSAYHTVHGYPGGADALAVRMGMSPNTLKHKVNPNNTTHHLTLREAITIQELSNSHAILHSMADALGYVCTRATPGDDNAPPLDVLAGLHAELADLHRAMADALRENESVSINQMWRIDHHAQQSIASICNALAMMRARMRKQPEAY